MELLYPIKVSKFWKQIILSSHGPKNQRNFSHFFALTSKKSWKVVQTKDESTKMLIWCYLTQWNTFIVLIRPLLEARAKNGKNFVGFLGYVWEDKIICFQNLLTFTTEKRQSLNLYCTLTLKISPAILKDRIDEKICSSFRDHA